MVMALLLLVDGRHGARCGPRRLQSGWGSVRNVSRGLRHTRPSDSVLGGRTGRRVWCTLELTVTRGAGIGCRCQTASSM